MRADNRPSGSPQTDAPEQPDLALWAKWLDDGKVLHPVAAHLLDTAAAAEALIDQWLPHATFTGLARLAKLSPDDTRTLVVRVAGTHDLGKLNPHFQGQRGHNDFKSHLTRLVEAGYESLPVGRWDAISVAKAGRHEELTDLMQRPDLAVPCVAGLVGAGHHGSWNRVLDEHTDPADELDLEAVEWIAALRPGAGTRWSDQVEAHIRLIDQLVTNDPGVDCQVRAMPILASLVSLADWLASDEATVRDANQHPAIQSGSWAQYLADRRDFFAERVVDVLGRPHKPRSFEDAFGFKPTRPVQQATVVERPEPGLTIVMVPPGEGKTEAALGHWMLNHGSDTTTGLLFALPTMATTDAMFDRIRAMFEHTDRTGGVLAHGRAILNAFYDPPGADMQVATNDPAGGLTANRWFTGRHRALLAPVTVATVDQLLVGALRHRYNFMRFLGAAGKTVILDEVHAYDTRMTVLTERFLGWAGAMGTDVVLLSATLPASRLTRFVNAYRAGMATATDSPAPTDEITPHYPGVVRVDSTGVTTTPVETTRAVTVTVTTTPAEPDNVATTITQLVHDTLAEHPTAKVGVIVNTVGRAQQVAQTVNARWLLHSRFPASVRADRTAAAIDAFGKTSAPGVDVLVGTQVIEMSVDVDFDVLITELCPAPSLVQRIGRVWRHDLTGRPRQRPSALSGPVCHIVDVPDGGENTYLPYTRAEITKTRAALHALDGQLRIPDAVQVFVDDAEVSYDDIAADPSMDSFTRHLVNEGAHHARAEMQAVPAPNEIRRIKHLEQVSAALLIEEDTRATRITSDAVTIIPVTAEPVPGCWTGPIPVTPTTDELRDLLGCTIPLSYGAAQRILAALDDTSPTGAVRRTGSEHALLRDLVIVDLDHTDLVTYNPTLGLLV